MDILQEYNPILVGTIPIDIDLPDSDLDIICEVHDFNSFEELVISSFQDFQDFRYSIRTVYGIRRIVVNFNYNGWPIEIFGQPIPSKEQNGYQHMIVEYRILKILGNKGHRMIRDLKDGGLKTEPAFAKLMKREGNAFELLLEIYDWEEDKLIDYLRTISIDA